MQITKYLISYIRSEPEKLPNSPHVKPKFPASVECPNQSTGQTPISSARRNSPNIGIDATITCVERCVYRDHENAFPNNRTPKAMTQVFKNLTGVSINLPERIAEDLGRVALNPAILMGILEEMNLARLRLRINNGNNHGRKSIGKDLTNVNIPSLFFWQLRWKSN